MRDLPISEEPAAWKDKVIWLGLPGSICKLGPKARTLFALDLLREVVPGDRLVIAMSAENQVTNANLRALTDVLENAELPLTPESVDRIAEPLR